MKKLSEIMAGLVVSLELIKGSKAERLIADAMAQAHDVGVDQCAPVIQDKNEDIRQARVEVEALHEQLQTAKKELQPLREQVDTAESEYVRIESINKGLVRRCGDLVEERNKLQDQHLDAMEAANRKYSEVLIDHNRRFKQMTEAKNEDRVELERLKKALNDRDDVIAKLYSGWTFLVQTRWTGPTGTGWTTIGIFTDHVAAERFYRPALPANSDAPIEIMRITAMKMNPPRNIEES